MNNEEIKQILDDLYAIDNSLRSREAELVMMIKTLAAKPKVKIDPEFKANLRSQLLAQKTYLPKISMFKNFQYAFVGVAVVVVAVIAVFAVKNNEKNNATVALFSGNTSITKVGDGAFGSLSTLNGVSNQSTQSGSAAGTAAPESTSNKAGAPMATGAGGAAALGTPQAMSSVGAGVSSPAMAPVPLNPDTRIAYPPYYQPYKYVYKGDTFTQDQAKLDVLKQIPTPISAAEITAALRSAGLGAIDLSSFSNANVSNITFSEDRDFGYTVNIDLTSGSFSLSQNYLKWPQNYDLSQNPVKMPASSTIIAIANQFVNDHSISLASYGEPEVMNTNNYYAIPMEAGGGTGGSAGGAAVKSSDSIGSMPIYYSDSVQVLYPLMINGKNVYTSDGSKTGMQVEVNLRYNRVSSVYGLTLQSFQSSSYIAITDVSKIISNAENPQYFYPIMYGGPVPDGGVTNGSTGNSTAHTAEIDLGTPTMGYVQLYQWNNTTGQGSQYLVPAFIFPVTGAPTNYYSGQNRSVVVPIIQDFLQDNQVRILEKSIPPSPPAIPVPQTAPAGTSK